MKCVVMALVSITLSGCAVNSYGERRHANRAVRGMVEDAQQRATPLHLAKIVVMVAR